MKKGEVLTGIVERVDFPNKGIVKTEEGSCIVKNSLPGQEIAFAVQKVRKGKAEGRLLEVKKSPFLRQMKRVRILEAAEAALTYPCLMKSSCK